MEYIFVGQSERRVADPQYEGVHAAAADTDNCSAIAATRSRPHATPLRIHSTARFCFPRKRPPDAPYVVALLFPVSTPCFTMATPVADTSRPKLGVIGGTSLLTSTLFAALTPTPTVTPYGTVTLHTSSSSPLVFLQRHVSTPGGAYTPPHAIAHRAHAAALAAAGVTRVLAVCCVGSLNAEVPPGTLVIPDDYSALYCPPVYLYDDARAHIVPGLDAPLRDRVLLAIRRWAAGDGVGEGKPDGAASGSGVRVVEAGVYVQTPGPRFETPAEVRMLAAGVGTTAGVVGVVGMTAANEATVCKEGGLPYVAVCMVDNYANGVGGDKLTEAAFHESVKRNVSVVESVVKAVLQELDAGSVPGVES